MFYISTIILCSIFAQVLTITQVTRAKAYLFKAEAGKVPTQLIGEVDFEQSGSFLKINGSVEGLPIGKHGFHIHEKGDTGNGCLNAGPHYNPHKLSHGAPNDSNRHIGDLGNIETMPSMDTTIISVSDSLTSLTGIYSIIGRSVVVHEKVDDLGRGNTDQSKTTGNAGARLACGVIGVTEERSVQTTTASVVSATQQAPIASAQSSTSSSAVDSFLWFICFLFSIIIIK